MKEYTDIEFTAVIDECVAEVAEMLKPEPPKEKKSWTRYVVGIII
uniref:Uncharacterized protein n=1 Tax=viral metagenome TaxID=1070528 RepID=A0A6H1ZL46_9ZZZZ